MPFAEIVLSTSETSYAIHKETAAGKLRKIAPTLYTPNMVDPPASIIKRNLWRVVGLYCPGAIITDRTGIESRPADDGSVFVVHDRKTDVVLPGLRIRPRRGPGPTAADRHFIGTLYMAAPGRLLLENLRPSRARSGVSRTLKREELEAYLERMLSRQGADALNRLRDEARQLAPVLSLDKEMQQLDRLIGALLGTQDDPKVSAPTALARLAGRPYDPSRVEIFETLRAELATQAPELRLERRLEPAGADNLAFFEAYFSNYIEGTEFEIDEAVDIVFNNVLPASRPEDAHDVLGTFRIASDPTEMRQTPQTFEMFLALLKRRHAAIMEQRPEKAPGQFKDIVNRVGQRYFVAPDLVVGTLAQGFDMCRSLVGAFERAAFVMFVITEVHPFRDGNGRVARAMMNAELVAAGEQRILIPIVYRDNYLAALRALTNDGYATPYLRMLDFAQRYARAIPWDSFEQARRVLTATNAFMRPDEADDQGARLRMPTAAQLQDAADAFPAGPAATSR